MKQTNLIKKLTACVIASAFTVGAHASFIDVAGLGGFNSAFLDSGAEVFAESAATILADPDIATLYDPLPIPGLYQGVRWGNDAGNGQSSLYLTDYSTSIDALDTNYLVSTLTHNNVGLASPSSLWLSSASILGLLGLSNADGGIVQGFSSSTIVPGGAFDTMLPTLFDISFEETSNKNNIANCKVQDEDGIGELEGFAIAVEDRHVNVTACDDYFDYTLNDGNLSFPFAVPLYISGINYKLNIFATVDAEGLTPIGQNRFWTTEDGETSVYTWVNLQKVPEPASIAILGLTLLGFAAARKRKS